MRKNEILEKFKKWHLCSGRLQYYEDELVAVKLSDLLSCNKVYGMIAVNFVILHDNILFEKIYKYNFIVALIKLNNKDYIRVVRPSENDDSPVYFDIPIKLIKKLEFDIKTKTITITDELGIINKFNPFEGNRSPSNPYKWMDIFSVETLH